MALRYLRLGRQCQLTVSSPVAPFAQDVLKGGLYRLHVEEIGQIVWPIQ